MAEMEENMDPEVLTLKDGQISKERADAIQQNQADLATITPLTSRMISLSHHWKDCESKGEANQSVIPNQQPMPAQRRSTRQKSPSEAEWHRQKKKRESVSNPAIDAIVEVTGLEDVKSQVLRINQGKYGYRYMSELDLEE